MTSLMCRPRRLLAAAGLVAATLATASPAQAGPAGVRVTLPAPGGPHEIGTVSLHLVDRSRPDPWVASAPYRELMVSLWYPARGTAGHRLGTSHGAGCGGTLRRPGAAPDPAGNGRLGGHPYARPGGGAGRRPRRAAAGRAVLAGQRRSAHLGHDAGRGGPG